MHQDCSLAYPGRQRGAALLMFMLFTFLAATSWFLTQSSATGARNQLDNTTATALAQAKEALIGRAATDDNRPGSLPCPDTNNDGIADLFVGSNCPAYVGRLPWKTLDLPEMLDGNGDSLWYALSPGLRDYPVPAQPINPQQALQLTFDGVPNIAAIIFSPGRPLPNHIGRPGNAATDYLDGSNNDGDNIYISGPHSPIFNDRALVITRDNLFNVVNRRILGELRGDALTGGLIATYSANGSNYPWAAADALGVPSAGQLNPYIPHTALLLANATNTIMLNNNWYPLVTYNVDAARQQVVLTINTPTPMSCKITPGQPLCQ